jgi:hypothetical protein
MKTMSEIMLASVFFLGVRSPFVPTIMDICMDRLKCTDGEKTYCVKITWDEVVKYFDNPPKKYIKNKERVLKFINSNEGQHDPKYYDKLFKESRNFSTGE